MSIRSSNSPLLIIRNGSGMVSYFAMIAAWTGEKDLACEELAEAIRLPSPPSYGYLNCCRFGIRCGATLASKRLSPPRTEMIFATDYADNTRQTIEMTMRAGRLPAGKCHQPSGALWLEQLNNLTI